MEIGQCDINRRSLDPTHLKVCCSHPCMEMGQCDINRCSLDTLYTLEGCVANSFVWRWVSVT